MFLKCDLVDEAGWFKDTVLEFQLHEDLKTAPLLLTSGSVAQFLEWYSKVNPVILS